VYHDIVIAIHPEYADLIYRGLKKYEFRKIKPAKQLGFAYLYETKPCGLITGKVRIARIVEGTPYELWSWFGKDGGITNNDLRAYYSGKRIGYAYELESPLKFSVPRTLQSFNINHAPQSFIYK